MRVLVATAIWPKTDRPELGTYVRTQARALEDAGLDVEVLVLDGRNRKLIYPKGIVQLRRRIAANPPDLVHAHYSYVGFVARTQLCIPVVLTFHGDDILGTAGTDGQCSRRSKLIAAAGSALGEFVAAVIVQTEEMARRFRRTDVHVIPHEVDSELFHPLDRRSARAQLGLDPDRPYLLFAASPEIPGKNFRLAQRALEIVRHRRPEVEMLVVHKEPQPRLALYMNASDVLVFPSWQEGSPNIVKQALACNLPLVATRVGDVAELIGGIAGYHIAPPDADAFATLILAELEQRRRTNGRTAVAHLTPARVASRLISAYEQTLRTRYSPRQAGAELARGTR